MLVPVTQKGFSCLALAIPRINNRADVKRLRNALLEMLDCCISDEEVKECISGLSMHFVLNVITELTKDLEDKERGE